MTLCELLRMKLVIKLFHNDYHRTENFTIKPRTPVAPAPPFYLLGTLSILPRWCLALFLRPSAQVSAGRGWLAWERHRHVCTVYTWQRWPLLKPAPLHSCSLEGARWLYMRIKANKECALCANGADGLQRLCQFELPVAVVVKLIKHREDSIWYLMNMQLVMAKTKFAGVFFDLLYDNNNNN